MPGRGKRVPNAYNLHVPLDIAAHPQAAHALLLSVIKHLSFAREQCHAPYSQLEVHAKACQQQQHKQHAGRRRRLPSVARKAIKFFERLTVLLQLAGNIPYSQLEGLCVAVLLGSSAMRPREVYCLHFPHMSHQSGAMQAPPAAAAVCAATRKLQRAFIMNTDTVTEWDDPPGPTKMWLLFQAPEGALAAAPEGFLVRRAFSINLRKAFQVNVLMDQHGVPPSTGAQLQQKQCAHHHHQQQQPQLQPGWQQPQQMTQQQQSQQPDQLRAGAAGTGACGHAVGMEVDDLSQQLSLHMSMTDAGAAAPLPVWYQCSIHVKGLKPLSSHR